MSTSDPGCEQPGRWRFAQSAHSAAGGGFLRFTGSAKREGDDGEGRSADGSEWGASGAARRLRREQTAQSAAGKIFCTSAGEASGLAWG